jgi:hypothetical protein
MEPVGWSALSSLRQLTGLRLTLWCASRQCGHLQHIVEAAPQLQELWLDAASDFGHLAHVTRLRGLSSLQLAVSAGDAPSVCSLTAIRGLTHLGLALGAVKQPGALVAAAGQLTGLASLALDHLDLEYSGDSTTPLEPLAALQQLTDQP